MLEENPKPKIKRSLFRNIINVFIGMFLGIIVLLIIALGFTQTKTFRDLLRDKVIEIVNEEINGKLSIENIEGTILTSIFLRNTSLTVENDTLLLANKIEIKASPLQLIIQKIYIRKILLEDIQINLFQDSSGIWNFEKLAKPSPEDSTKSTFDYFIQINDLQFKNINVVQQSYGYKGSEENYKIINYDDLRINELYLSAQAYIDLENSNYLLLLKELSFIPNLERFALRNISGDFALTTDFVSVRNFAFISDSSDVRIDARIDSLNLFGDTEFHDFRNYPLTLSVNASSFNFDDLSSFIESTEILKGNPSLELKAHGKFGDFDIKKLSLDYKETHLEISGKVTNLNIPDKLRINAKITDTDINYKDVNALLPSLELPEFAMLSVSGVNIEFDGEPLDFKSKFSGNIEKGNLRFECSMNLKKNIPTYNIKFETGELDLSPIIGFVTKLNSAGSFTGRGFSPADLNSNFRFDMVNSSFNDIIVDNFSINSKAADRKIDLTIEGNSGDLETLIIGDMVFDNDTIPAYSLLGSINKLDLSTVLNNDSLQSDLNFYFSAEGRHLDPDEIVGIFSFGVDSSKFRDTEIKYSNIDFVFSKDSTFRKINLISDFLDFNFEGNFSVSDAAELIIYETSTISKIIADKLNELNPIAIVNQDINPDSLIVDIPQIVNKELDIDYSFTFKDFALIASLIGNERFDIAGSGSGNIKNTAENFSINTSLNLDYFVSIEKELTIYVSDIDADINFVRDNRSTSFDKLFGALSLTGKRFYSGGNIENITADIVFNQSKLFFHASANIGELLDFETNGLLFMNPSEQKLHFSKISLNYNNSAWTNKDTIKVLFNPDYFKITYCELYNDTSVVKLKGIVESSGNIELLFEIDNLNGALLTKYATGIQDHKLVADGRLTILLSGSLSNPVLDTEVRLEHLSYDSFKLGNLIGNINYANKNITSDIRFIDSTYNKENPLLTLSGTIPIDLSFTEVENRFIEGKEIDLKLKSENFNLVSFGHLLPQITEQQGNILADLSIKGSFNNPIYSGYLSLRDAKFRARDNNLFYTAGLKLNFVNQAIKIDSMIIANAGGTRYGSSIRGNGEIILDGFSIKDLTVRLNGSLAVLSEQSRSVSPLLYGDLVIGTERDWLFTISNNKMFFKGDILLRQTDLVYTTTTANNTLQTNNFNIIFVVDSSKIDKEQILFQDILLAEEKLREEKLRSIEQQLDFDYDISIKVERTAKLLFVLAQAANQKLTVEMQGELKFENVAGQQRAQGGFELLPGSKLDFIKTFDAEGLIRFETDITNPYLDIIATYRNSYINPRDPDGTPQDVAVKIHIEGPLQDLGKNLAANQQSLSVYVGSRNIQNNIRDTRYDYADAFSFILFGKFKDDLTAQDRTQLAGQSNAIGSTATSFLGSVLSNFVNSAVGDLVNNIQISQAGDQTKISLSGRYQNLRYSFGGSTESIQNISKANIKVEYSFTPRFIIRLERKDAVTQHQATEKKIDEIALKYRFDF